MCIVTFRPLFNSTVVAGNGKSVCSTGIMSAGQMFATDRGGCPSRQYWPIVWDDLICAGAPISAFKLDTVVIFGMNAGSVGTTV